MGFRDGLLAFIIIFGIGIALFVKHYRPVFTDMVTLLAALFISVFFIILALAVLVGPEAMKLPGLKTPLIALIVLILIWGVASTLGNDISNQLSGNAVTATDLVFKTDFLNLAVLMILSLFLFYIVLIKTPS